MESLFSAKNNSVWEAQLRIANSQNGEKYLYDVVEIKMVEGGGISPHTTTINNIPQTSNNNNGKKQSDNGGMFSLPVYQYDGETAKSRGIRSQAVNEFADSLGGMFGITGKIGREGLRKSAYQIADRVEKFGFITKADMDNFFDAAYKAARFTDEKADYAPLKKRIREAGIEPLGGREYLDFVQKYRGKIKFKRGGLPIDTLYQELNENNPEYFPDSIINQYEQMEKLGEALILKTASFNFRHPHP